MSLLARVFKPSAARRILQNEKFLPSFGPSDVLRRDGKGKRLLPERNGRSAKDNGDRFIQACIINVRYSALPPHRDSLGHGGPFETYYDPMGVSGREPFTLRLFLGYALIDAVRANNDMDDAVIAKVLSLPFYGAAAEAYRLKIDPGNAGLWTMAEAFYLKSGKGKGDAGLYASIVEGLNSSDLYS